MCMMTYLSKMMKLSRQYRKQDDTVRARYWRKHHDRLRKYVVGAA